jgi:hypothetical protein
VGIEDVLGAIGGAGTLTAWIAREIAKLQEKWSTGDPALKGFPVMNLLNSSRFILVHFLLLIN